MPAGYGTIPPFPPYPARDSSGFTKAGGNEPAAAPDWTTNPAGHFTAGTAAPRPPPPPPPAVAAAGFARYATIESSSLALIPANGGIGPLPVEIVPLMESALILVPTVAREGADPPRRSAPWQPAQFCV